MSEKHSFFHEFIEALHKTADFALNLGFSGSVEHLFKLDEHQIELAYTILLVNLASIDNDFSPRESFFIKGKLQEHLGISYEDAIELVKQARIIIDQKNIDLDQFGDYLAEHLPESKRQTLLKDVDTLIAEDRVHHPFEKHLRERYVRLLKIEKEEDTN